MVDVLVLWKLRGSISQESLINPSMRNGMCLISTAECCKVQTQHQLISGQHSRWYKDKMDFSLYLTGFNYMHELQSP